MFNQCFFPERHLPGQDLDDDAKVYAESQFGDTLKDQRPSMKDHRLIDERSRAFDRVIVEKLRRDPTLVDKARTNVTRWLQTCDPRSAPGLREWERLLDGPLPSLLALLASTDERATRLRQSSPFCGILTPAERLAIIRDFHARESVAA